MANGNENGQVQPVVTPVANARAWKKWSQEGEWFTLPGNGEYALLRRPSLMALAARSGHIPNPLSAEVLRWLANNSSDPYRSNVSPAEAIDQYKKNSAAFVAIAQECFLDPKIVSEYQCNKCGATFLRNQQRCPQCQATDFDWRAPDYGAGEISPYDIGDADYAWLVFSFVEGSLNRIQSFRVAGRDGETGAGSGNVPLPTLTTS